MEAGREFEQARLSQHVKVYTDIDREANPYDLEISVTFLFIGPDGERKTEHGLWTDCVIGRDGLTDLRAIIGRWVAFAVGDADVEHPTEGDEKAVRERTDAIVAELMGPMLVRALIEAD